MVTEVTYSMDRQMDNTTEIWGFYTLYKNPKMYFFFSNLKSFITYMVRVVFTNVFTSLSERYIFFVNIKRNMYRVPFRTQMLWNRFCRLSVLEFTETASRCTLQGIPILFMTNGFSPTHYCYYYYSVFNVIL